MKYSKIRDNLENNISRREVRHRTDDALTSDILTNPMAMVEYILEDNDIVKIKKGLNDGGDDVLELYQDGIDEPSWDVMLLLNLCSIACRQLRPHYHYRVLETAMLKFVNEIRKERRTYDRT